jgi:hypothetical protein
MAEATKTTVLGSLGQILIASIASYGIAKLSNSTTGWASYRNEMLAELGSTAISTALSQLSTAQATSTQTSTQA